MSSTLLASDLLLQIEQVLSQIGIIPTRPQACRLFAQLQNRAGFV
ncbi:hypothetical protein PPEP_a1532 [Pseudoalteromonas peptidolytica F12-50-A1]|uniref:Uncharacterized protein n=1 Tax=Pseudoalteromonas peptidolytica F12-50-A1 TaxID=1315280 RepID=A0A8I0MWF0_9GAMM|nr:hypothetical protein [Pseudoalteromonas peptidolytica F12-50-A1]